MKTKALNKLNKNKGETISEVLVALLISSLALVMLASMISATSKMIIKSKEKMTYYYEANNALESMTLPEENPKATKVNDFAIVIETADTSLKVEVPKAKLTCYANTQLVKPVYAYVYNNG